MLLGDPNTGFMAQGEAQGTWDIATKSYVGGSAKAITAPSGFTLTYLSGCFVSPDGTHLYITDQEGLVFEYAMSTPWDTSTLYVVRCYCESVLQGKGCFSDRVE